MKTVKTVNGVKRIEERDEKNDLDKLKEALLEHRKTLFTRLESDLNSYVLYRTEKKPSGRQLEGIKDKLHSLKHSGIALEDYPTITGHFLEHENTHVSAEPFYKEIDEHIEYLIKHT